MVSLTYISHNSHRTNCGWKTWRLSSWRGRTWMTTTTQSLPPSPRLLLHLRPAKLPAAHSRQRLLSSSSSSSSSSRAGRTSGTSRTSR